MRASILGQLCGQLVELTLHARFDLVDVIPGGKLLLSIRISAPEVHNHAWKQIVRVIDDYLDLLKRRALSPRRKAEAPDPILENQILGQLGFGVVTAVPHTGAVGVSTGRRTQRPLRCNQRDCAKQRPLSATAALLTLVLKPSMALQGRNRPD